MSQECFLKEALINLFESPFQSFVVIGFFLSSPFSESFDGTCLTRSLPLGSPSSGCAAQSIQTDPSVMYSRQAVPPLQGL